MRRALTLAAIRSNLDMPSDAKILSSNAKKQVILVGLDRFLLAWTLPLFQAKEAEIREVARLLEIVKATQSVLDSPTFQGTRSVRARSSL